MRRVHLPPERIGETQADLTEAARHYLTGVLRLGAGDEVELFDGLGHAWTSRILPDLATLELGPRHGVAPHGSVDLRGAPIHLLFALAKGEKCDLVVQKATELGAMRLVPFAAERSVVRLEGEKAADRAARWERIVAEAARQCGRLDLPGVTVPGTLAEALAAVPAGFHLVVLQGGGPALGRLGLEGALGVAAVVGPEGGLTEAEVEACRAAGALVGGLGPRTLRAETAAIAAVALLQGLVGDIR